MLTMEMEFFYQIVLRGIREVYGVVITTLKIIPSNVIFRDVRCGVFFVILY